MATAILQIELAEPVAARQLDGAARCMLVFRWRGRIVGRRFVDAHGRRLTAADVARAAEGCGADALLHWLAETVEYDARRFVGGQPVTATVAICTRDRPDDLHNALRGVTVLAPAPQEILVVDNASQPGEARRVAAAYRGVRYVHEALRGLNAARNRALREARSDIVAFTDDDAVPEPDWLGALTANFADPQVLCATGLTLPSELDTDAQELFEQVTPFARGFRRRVFDGQHENPLHVGPIGAGVNMALRRDVLERVGPFDERLDGGTPTRSGGDHEMFARILSAGYRIAYDPAAVSWHRHRRTHAEVTATVRGYGTGVYAMWTGLLLERHELGVVRLAWSWFRAEQLPELLRPLRGVPASPASRIVRACCRGCADGPRAWFAARRLRAGDSCS
jgi:cellulose synthase/poly-beta-1,6-N-acetylglucosamine synthase-like glycosyltransferase